MFLVEKEPKSIVAEAYRVLRTNIQYSSYDKAIKTIVVTSSEPGEGKTTVASSLAISFAQDKKSVILVDCDLRRPMAHKNFKLSNRFGLSDVLIGKVSVENAIQKYTDNFHIITSGKIPPNPAEMLASNVMESLIEGLSKNYDIVILDTPPLRAVTDAQILSTKVDGTILVVRAERTKNESVVESKALLDKVSANIIGTVFYATNNSKSKYYYYYGSEEESKGKRRR